jgi:hypothetical protein
MCYARIRIASAISRMDADLVDDVLRAGSRPRRVDRILTLFHEVKVRLHRVIDKCLDHPFLCAGMCLLAISPDSSDRQEAFPWTSLPQNDAIGWRRRVNLAFGQCGEEI